MKKYLLTFLTFSFCYMQGNIGGYAIFDYSNASGNDGFDIKRAYFSYSSDISEELLFKIRLDVGRDQDGGKLNSYLKNAYVDWKCENGDKLSMGLIGTNSYGVQEKNWGYRFVEKSVLDKYIMTNTADFGIGYSKKFGQFKTSLQLLNGEGFKSEESNNQQALYFSLLYGESKLNQNDGFNFGVVINHVPQEDGIDNSLVGFFGGWASNNLRFGLEHNQYKEKAFSYTKDVSSLYTNYTISDNWDIFFRHDIHNEELDVNMLPENSGELPSEFAIYGGVWNPTKGLYISPNVHVADGTHTYHLTCMFQY